MNLYILGGSPCSGKSTVAEILSRECDFTYFKVDENLMSVQMVFELDNERDVHNSNSIKNQTPLEFPYLDHD